MLGAMIGDIVGSIYEFHNIRTKEFEFFSPDCFFTDDSVMTAAVAEALLDTDGEDSEAVIRDRLIDGMKKWGENILSPAMEAGSEHGWRRRTAGRTAVSATALPCGYPLQDGCMTTCLRPGIWRS